MTEVETKVDQAFVDVFGQSPGDLAQATHIYGKFDPEYLRVVLATTPAAQKKGVDGTRFGAVAVTDPSQLPTEAHRQHYELAKQYGDQAGRPTVYMNELDTWVEYGGGVGHYEASLKGEIDRQVRTDAEGNFRTVTVYTPAAIATMGGSFTVPGYDTGEVVYVPEGTSAGELWKAADGTTSDGYRQLQATGELGGGLLGAISDFTGIDEFEELIDIIPDEVWGVADFATMGNAVGIVGGAKAQLKAWDAIEDLGVDIDDYRQFQGYANIASDLAIAVATFGTGTAAKQAAFRELGARGIQRTVNRAALDSDFGFEEAFPAVLSQVAGTYLQFPNAYAQAATQGVLRGMSTGDWTAAALSAGGDILGRSMGDSLGITAELAVDAMVNTALGLDTKNVILGAIQTGTMGALRNEGSKKDYFRLPSGSDFSDDGFHIFPTWNPNPEYNFKEDFAAQLTEAFSTGTLWSDFAAAAMPWNSLFKAGATAYQNRGDLKQKFGDSSVGQSLGPIKDKIFQSSEEYQRTRVQQ